MVIEAGGGTAGDLAFDGDGDVDKRPVARLGGEGVAAVERVRLVGGNADVLALLVHALTEHVIDRCMRTVDRQLREVRPTQTADLGVQVGEQATLQQGIGGDIDTRGQVAGVEGDLLGLLVEVGDILVQGHGAHDLHRGEFLRHDLGGIEQVDALEHLLLVVGEDLQT